MNVPPEALKSIKENSDIALKSEDIRASHTRLHYEDLCDTGKIWSQAINNAIVNARVSLVPIVYADKKDTSPKKPPPMKYEDLPIYSSPHYEYRDYVEDMKKCPNADVKILHERLFPSVQKYRREWKESVCGMTNELRDIKGELCGALCKNIRCFKLFMRDPNNCAIRQAVVVLGTATGVYIGSGTRGITRKLFFGTLGALAAGALCFPRETDEIFRNTTYKISKFAIALYNAFTGDSFAMRERLPCPDDLPPPPPPRKSSEINKRCEERECERARQKEIEKKEREICLENERKKKELELENAKRQRELELANERKRRQQECLDAANK